MLVLTIVDLPTPRIRLGRSMILGRYWRTLRHLRREQLIGQVLLRLRPLWEKLGPRPSHHPSQDQFSFGTDSSLDLAQIFGPVPSQPATELLQNRFQFAGVTHSLGPDIDWTASQLPLLWQYQLHYFDWLWSLSPNEAEQRQFGIEAIASWMEHAESLTNKVAWAPYPTSLRLMNWSLLFHGPWKEAIAAQPELAERIRGSCWRQAKWLERHLEYHLLANHLLENAVALVVVGKLWTGSDANHWKAVGKRLLERELNEQFLSDGMHFERSPMYHLRCCWLLDVLFVLLGNELPNLKAIRERARIALKHVIHPDGDIALLNDSAFDVYALPDFSSIDEAQGDGCWALADAGYYGARWQGNYWIIDAGTIGPDYQPGHAHADYLTLEWSVDGVRFLTDTGVYDYQIGPSRAWDRSTQAHNTVTWNDQDSCEVWGTFRVGNRCRPKIHEWLPTDRGFTLKASHDGYGKRTHQRRIEATVDRLVVTDQILGDPNGEFCSRWHIDPRWICLSQSPLITFIHKDLKIHVKSSRGGLLRIGSSRYSPRFGVALERPVIEHRLDRPQEPWQIQFQVERTS